MAVNTLIQFTQGATVGTAGQALFGTTGTSVTVANGGTNPALGTWTFTVLDVPAGSAVPTGQVQSGATQTWPFTPDVTGGYLIQLTVTDLGTGNVSTDVRCFGVKTSTGRFNPAFTSDNLSLNFAGQLRGWATYMDAWLAQVDAQAINPFVSANSALFGSTVSGGGNPLIGQAGMGPNGGTATSLNIQPQVANASGNSTGGNLNILLTQSNSGAEAYFVIQRNAATRLQFGVVPGFPTFGAIYGSAAPSATNYAFLADGVSVTTVNVPTGNTINLAVNGATQVLVGSGLLAFSATANFLGGPFITQAAPTTDVAALSMAIAAQNALPGATTNRTGGSLLLEPGAGSTTNGTPGNVQVFIPSPSGTGTAGQFQTKISGQISFFTDNQGAVLGRTDASQFGTRIAPFIGSETTAAGFWTGSAATAPTASNSKFSFGAGNTGSDSWTASTINFDTAGGGAIAIQFALTNANTGQIIFGPSINSTPTISQSQQANGSNPNNFVIAPQAPGAGASTTATGTPGSFVVNLAAPVSTGADGALIAQVAATTYFLAQRFNLLGGSGALWLGSNAASQSTSNFSFYADASATILNAPTGDTIFIRIGNATAVATGVTNGLQLFSGTTSFGGGVGVLGIAAATTLPTTLPTGFVLAVDNSSAQKGIHAYGPSTNFFDYMVAPTTQGTANTQANKVFDFAGVARTTTNTAVTILTIPLATSGTNASINVTVEGRDVTAGTVGDGFTALALLQYKNVAGTVTAGATQAAQLKSNDTSMASCTLTALVSGTNILIQVTGLASVTIDWTAIATEIIT